MNECHLLKQQEMPFFKIVLFFSSGNNYVKLQSEMTKHPHCLHENTIAANLLSGLNAES